MARADLKAPSTFTLVAKPRVFLYQGRWRVDAAHTRGIYIKTGWPTQVSAMNSARLIALTSAWQLPPNHVDVSGSEVGGRVTLTPIDREDD